MEQVKHSKKSRFFESWVWYIFVLPTLLGIVLFMAYPILESLRLSFYQSNGTTETWVGLNNYKLILTSEPFRKAVYNTFFIGFWWLAVTIPLGFVIASLINGLSFAKNTFKSIFFIPYMTSLVAAAAIFLFVLHPDMGPLNTLLDMFGLPTMMWLAEPLTARIGAVILASWQWLGFVVVICIANLQAIPRDLYEAAGIDGANWFQKWKYITIPKMKGTFSFLLIMGWIKALQRFAETYVLGGPQGSPARSLYTVVGFIYERGFGGNEYGLASAAAYVLFIIILVFTFINMKVSKFDV
ncbi:sugar ABC transporter permease [Acidaminobacter sp. JC074]|uniref:carbohydrate ABC transporter permease n=1 Tax=Acidaminobacter sp. JC074 TaxID=2530199 RepID=UPI001F10082B|nr:sugar ABC transporter permease [Acidaminobacter sp. JC074]MCH4889651.1 sugar ABC transporter permease [Acidaminobacter sp. JC074]